MNIKTLKALAGDVGIGHPADYSSQKSLVRAIQIQRGEKPCFLTDKRYTCKDDMCEWRESCRKLVAVWLR